MLLLCERPIAELHVCFLCLMLVQMTDTDHFICRPALESRQYVNYCELYKT